MSTSTQGDTSPTVSNPVPNTNGDTNRAQQSPPPIPAAKTPVGPGVVTVVGLVFAVLVIAVGVVGVHDALVGAGAAAGTPWIDTVVKALNGLRPAFWLVPVGAALVLLGLWLLLTALRPRPRTAIALKARTGVFLRPSDVATLARSAAQNVDGVTSAKVTASPRKIAVAARTTTGGLQQNIAQAVTTQLRTLVSEPTVRVTIKTDGGYS